MEAVLLLSRDADVIDVVSRAAAAQPYMLILCEPNQARVLPDGCAVRAVLFDRDIFANEKLFAKEASFLRSRFSQAAFLFFSTSAEPEEQIRALDAGCQLCLSKPLNSELLLAHLRAFARATPTSQPDPSLRRLSTLEIDVRRFTAFAAGEPLPLTHAEFVLLEVLTRDPGKPVHHAELGDALWGWESENYSGHLKSHISRLRTKLASACSSAKIICIRGTGYAVSIF